ncbi:mycofactocin system FadH/OYE family oxidoreductase 2 [compost metagenome]
MPGLEKGNVFTVEAVMARQARLGERVLLLDEGGGWRGCGTAWKLAEDGHEVAILTPDPFVGKELQRTAADAPMRQALRKLGVTWIVEASITEWHGNGATIIDHTTGECRFIDADALVTATTNAPADWLMPGLAERGIATQQIGDCAAPRQAPYAFYEGRKAGLEI